MTFTHSEWLFFLLLPVLILIIGKVCIHRRKVKNEVFVSSPYLIERLVTHKSKTPLMLKVALTFIACLLSIIALAAPYQGRTVERLPNSGRHIYIAIDLSRSMLVKDVFPDRLTKAKTSAIEIIETFSNEQICLISFAGSAWVEAPLTLDHNALKETVLSLDENSIPYGGSTSKALFDLMSALNNSQEKDESLLVILSDGEFHAPLIEKQIYQVTRNRFRVFTLGVGTNNGDLVPDTRSDDGFFRNKEGQTVISRIQEANLKKIASLGNGRYFQTDDYTFIPRISSALEAIESEDESASNRITYNYIHHWFLLASTIFAFLAVLCPRIYRSFSKKVLLVGFMVLPLQRAEAFTLLPNYNVGYNLYAAERYEEAAKYFEVQATKAYGKMSYKLRFSQGVAEYRAKKYPNAISSFSLSLLVQDRELQSESHYNLGNSLFTYGKSILKIIPDQESKEHQLRLRTAVISQWSDALDHFSSTLDLTPNHGRAQENFFNVFNLLENLKRTQLKEIEEKEKEDAKKKKSKENQEGDQGKDAPPSEDAKNYTWDELEKILEKHKSAPPKEPPLSEQEASAQQKLLKQEQRTKEYARRKLRQHSDIKKGYLKTGRRNYSEQPLNNW